MKSFVAVLALVGVVCCVLTQEDVDKINRESSWTASLDAPKAKMTTKEAREFLGLDLEARGGLRSVAYGVSADALPASFDARDNWPDCQSIKMIRDQSDCGSCWAFGAVESMSDRECIINKQDIILSAEDMNSCSVGSKGQDCGSCNGGQDACAWQYFATKGVVTEDCYPYSLPGCDHHIENSTNPCPDRMYKTPTCQTGCSVQGESWNKYYGETPYAVHNEADIMNEIYTNGPCETGFTVYEDFLTYTGGIYKHVTGASDGGHAVKFIGWGEENGEKYWLVANSWNEHWGEKGFFRILRGTNECGIEDTCNCGIPKQL
ncbi:Sarcophaga pro-cathepsin B [Pelomyxa schiedti]|nr:Sarcophaga pro-cathepsin B [Pelomyxa schiedti]